MPGDAAATAERGALEIREDYATCFFGLFNTRPQPIRAATARKSGDPIPEPKGRRLMYA